MHQRLRLGVSGSVPHPDRVNTYSPPTLIQFYSDNAACWSRLNRNIISTIVRGFVLHASYAAILPIKLSKLPQWESLSKWYCLLMKLTIGENFRLLYKIYQNHCFAKSEYSDNLVFWPFNEEYSPKETDSEKLVTEYAGRTSFKISTSPPATMVAHKSLHHSQGNLNLSLI